jgi:hypothetical protein
MQLWLLYSTNEKTLCYDLTEQRDHHQSTPSKQLLPFTALIAILVLPKFPTSISLGQIIKAVDSSLSAADKKHPRSEANSNFCLPLTKKLFISNLKEAKTPVRLPLTQPVGSSSNQNHSSYLYVLWL